jgi:hypothetical protein
VKAAFRFSELTGVRLVIKNTGHDYIGRSSAPDSLTLMVSNRILRDPPLTVFELDEEFEGSESSYPTYCVWALIDRQITYSENFQPEGCRTTSPGVTMGVGLIHSHI